MESIIDRETGHLFDMEVTLRIYIMYFSTDRLLFSDNVVFVTDPTKNNKIVKKVILETIVFLVFHAGYFQFLKIVQ